MYLIYYRWICDVRKWQRWTLTLELALEHVARARSVTERVRHVGAAIRALIGIILEFVGNLCAQMEGKRSIKCVGLFGPLEP